MKDTLSLPRRGSSTPPPPVTTRSVSTVSSSSNGTTPVRMVMVEEQQPLSWFVIQVTAVASLGGCLFGYDMGAIGSALPQLTTSFDLSNSQQEWVVSILYLGGGLGACVGGTICDVVGRQRTIIITDIIFIVGATILYIAHSINTVLVGRFIVGFGIAVSGVADVSYLHEIAPLQWRGAIVSVNEACISLGFLLAYVAGYVYHESENEEWRIIFGWAGILAFIQFIGMISMPESPSWLAEQGRYEESQNAWKRIHGESYIMDQHHHHHNVEKEEENVTDDNDPIAPPLNTTTLATGNEQQQQQLWAPQYNSVDSVPIPTMTATTTMTMINHIGHSIRDLVVSFRTFFASLLSQYRRQSYITVFLSICQQFCGQTSVLNYAPLIFAQAIATNNNNDNNDGNGGDSDQEPPQWSTVAIGVVKFLVTVMVIVRIEFIGRRNLLLFGMVIISLGLLCLTVAFGGLTTPGNDSTVAAAENEGGDIYYDDQVVASTTTTEDASWTIMDDSSFTLALPGVLLVVSGYSMSFGPLTWLLTSELFPTEIRGRALGVSTIVTYLCASLVTRTFLSAQTFLGPSKVFGIYLAVTVLGLVFAYMAIPDTGGKTVEQVDVALRGMQWWKFEHLAIGGGGQFMDETSCLDSNTTNDSNNDGTVGGEGGGLPYARHSTPPRRMTEENNYHGSNQQLRLPELT